MAFCMTLQALTVDRDEGDSVKGENVIMSWQSTEWATGNQGYQWPEQSRARETLLSVNIDR